MQAADPDAPLRLARRHDDDAAFGQLCFDFDAAFGQLEADAASAQLEADAETDRRRAEAKKRAAADRAKVRNHPPQFDTTVTLHPGRMMCVGVIRAACAAGLWPTDMALLMVVGAWLGGDPRKTSTRGLAALGQELGRWPGPLRDSVRRLEDLGWIVVTRRKARKDDEADEQLEADAETDRHQAAAKKRADYSGAVERTAKIAAGPQWLAAVDAAVGADKQHAGRLLDLGTQRALRSAGCPAAALLTIAVQGAWMVGDIDAEPGRGRADLLDVLGLDKRSSAMSRPLRALRETGWLAGSRAFTAGPSWRAQIEQRTAAPAAVDVAAAAQPTAAHDAPHPAWAATWGALASCCQCDAPVKADQQSGQPLPACKPCWDAMPAARKRDVTRQHKRDIAAAQRAAAQPIPEPDRPEPAARPLPDAEIRRLVADRFGAPGEQSQP